MIQYRYQKGRESRREENFRRIKDEMEENVMAITATELKSNLSKYLLLAETEDILITRNGKVVAKLSSPYEDRVDIANSLFGVLPADVTLDDARKERMNQI